jgi:cytoskeletal protein RodZ
VATATHIKPSFLEALEDGDFAALPGPAYITGFLRNYARGVGLHPDDILQEYYSCRPLPQPSVKPATRVLANGRQRQHRSRILWTLTAVALMLLGGFAVKAYNDAYSHAYSAAPPSVTAASIVKSTAPRSAPAPPAAHPARPHPVTVRLHATAPVWVRVTVDGRRVFQGILRVRWGWKTWTGRGAIYLMTVDGAHLKAVYDGRRLGLIAAHPGLLVDVATPSGWSQIS